MNKLTSLAPIAAFALVSACVDTATSTGATAPGGIPAFSATCPLGISVRANAGGPVFVNGVQATTQAYSTTFYESVQGDVTISTTIGGNGAVDVSYNKRNAGNGVCNVV